MAVRHATLSKQALLASGALRAYLKPKLATDTKLDLNSILQPVTAANWEDQKPMIKTALDKALVGKLAKDAEICDIIDILKELDDAVDKEDDEMGADEKDEDDEEEKKKAKEGAEKCNCSTRLNDSFSVQDGTNRLVGVEPASCCRTHSGSNGGEQISAPV
jgi:hypothetical protein